MNTRLEKNAKALEIDPSKRYIVLINNEQNTREEGKALLDILHKRGHTDVTVLMTRGDVRSAVDVVEIPRDGRPES